jgi:hypothetical protein
MTDTVRTPEATSWRGSLVRHSGRGAGSGGTGRAGVDASRPRGLPGESNRAAPATAVLARFFSLKSWGNVLPHGSASTVATIT